MQENEAKQMGETKEKTSEESGRQSAANIQNYFESEIQLIIFNVNNVEYAVGISNITEIIKMIQITPMPNVPESIVGVINLRGKVIPVIDLRERFLSPNRENTKKTKIMIATIRNAEVGLIADEVSDVIGLSSNQIDPPLPLLSGIKMEFMKGIAKLRKRLIIIIDIIKLLTSNERLFLKGNMNE